MCEIDWDLFIQALAPTMIFFGAIIAFLEYKKNKKWKEAEFLAGEYQRFIGDSYVKKAFLMLDGYTTCLAVNKNELDGRTEYLEVNPQKLLDSLKEHINQDERPKEEVYIQLCIDRFLFKFGVFQSHLDNKLVCKKQVKNYLFYWVKVIGDPSDNTISREIKEELHKFILKYNYMGVISLLAGFGFDIRKEIVYPEQSEPEE